MNQHLIPRRALGGIAGFTAALMGVTLFGGGWTDALLVFLVVAVVVGVAVELRRGAWDEPGIGHR
jgi:hypothetical protein